LKKKQELAQIRIVKHWRARKSEKAKRRLKSIQSQGASKPQRERGRPKKRTVCTAGIQKKELKKGTQGHLCTSLESQIVVVGTSKRKKSQKKDGMDRERLRQKLTKQANAPNDNLPKVQQNARKKKRKGTSIQ